MINNKKELIEYLYRSLNDKTPEMLNVRDIMQTIAILELSISIDNKWCITIRNS